MCETSCLSKNMILSFDDYLNVNMQLKSSSDIDQPDSVLLYTFTVAVFLTSAYLSINGDQRAKE